MIYSVTKNERKLFKTSKMTTYSSHKGCSPIVWFSHQVNNSFKLQYSSKVRCSHMTSLGHRYVSNSDVCHFQVEALRASVCFVMFHIPVP